MLGLEAIFGTWVTCCAPVWAARMPLPRDIAWPGEKLGNYWLPSPFDPSRIRCAAKCTQLASFWLYSKGLRSMGAECLWTAAMCLKCVKNYVTQCGLLGVYTLYGDAWRADNRCCLVLLIPSNGPRTTPLFQKDSCICCSTKDLFAKFNLHWTTHMLSEGDLNHISMIELS